MHPGRSRRSDFVQVKICWAAEIELAIISIVVTVTS
jgi:hypothetical protein